MTELLNQPSAAKREDPDFCLHQAFLWITQCYELRFGDTRPDAVRLEEDSGKIIQDPQGSPSDKR